MSDGTRQDRYQPGDTAEADQAAKLEGIGASPGTATGRVRILHDLDGVEAVEKGEIITTEMTSPDMVPAMKRAAGIITDEGGMTSHAAIVSRELGVPAIVGTSDATSRLSDGQRVRMDGDRGSVHLANGTSDAETESERSTDTDSAGESRPAGKSTRAPSTATGVKVNVSIPDAAERAAATGADGVGLLRLEHILLSMGKTPARYVSDHGEDTFVQAIAEEIRTVTEAFYPRPVRARTLDAPTDELAELEGGEAEPHEHNPMLGWRGIRRSLDEPNLARLELRAFKQLQEAGYDNVEVLFPLPNDPEEVIAARDLMADVGIDPDDRRWGVMIETPAAVRQIEAIATTGIDFVALGTNDLVQYILAVDRNNGQVADLFDEMHPAVLEAIGEVIEVCNQHDIATTITGQAGSKPEMTRFLVEEGISSVSANIDAVGDVRQVISRVEQQLILDSIRE